MSPELERSVFMHGEVMSQQSDLLQEREQFFQAASMEDDLYCGDERGSDLEAYLSLLGGVTNISYNLEVLKETTVPGSVTDAFDQTVGSQTPIIMHEGGLPNAGVHSDTHAEGEDANDVDASRIDGKVGCGYDELRGPISASIAEQADKILAIARETRPELFATDQDETAAQALVAAHGRIADREGVLPAGRKIVLSAKAAGAKSMVVRGDHVSKVGIINLRKDTKMDTAAAPEAGKPTYTHDQWVALEAFDKLHNLFPYDKRMFDMSETIDAIGTMLALGVEDIIVRR